LIKILFDDSNHITLKVMGHTGEYGKDIVCASVSALIQNIIVGLEKSSLEWDYTLEPGNAKIYVKRNETEDFIKSKFLLQTTIESLKIISKSYKNKLEVIHDKKI
jgi:uncharacterized protein YsxB (DUF464 family)